MENNQLYLMQLTRRTKQMIEELKSLNNRLRIEGIEVEEVQQVIRNLDKVPQLIERKIREKQRDNNS